jgi:precorrin-3B synthase
VGAPWCASGRIDTRAVASDLASWAADPPRTHVSGCERRCGAPAGDHLDLVAPSLTEARTAVQRYAHG